MSKKTRKKSSKTPSKAKAAGKTAGGIEGRQDRRKDAGRATRRQSQQAGSSGSKASHKAASKRLKTSHEAASKAARASKVRLPDEPHAGWSRAPRPPLSTCRATAAAASRLPTIAGKKLVLFFYPRADTPGCTREAIDFTRLAGAFADERNRGAGRLGRHRQRRRNPFATSTSFRFL